MKKNFKNKLKNAASITKKKAILVKEKGTVVIDNTKNAAIKGAEVAKETSAVAYKKALEVLDENGNGEIDIEDIIIKALKTPGVKINRADFLTKEFSTTCDSKTVGEIISKNPISAGVSIDAIDVLAEETIRFERNCVSGISAALGMPGGVAIMATIPADILQYYGYMLRTAQKLMYLYGFPEIQVEENGTQLDTATINMLTLCLGVMYGVAGANNAIKAMAKALSEGVSKQLMKKALTKGTIYPIVKSTLKWFNVNLTKKIFAEFFKKSIPVVGGVVGAGLTYATFKPCCEKLKASLKDTALTNPNTSNENEIVIEVRDIEY